MLLVVSSCTPTVSLATLLQTSLSALLQYSAARGTDPIEAACCEQYYLEEPANSVAALELCRSPAARC